MSILDSQLLELDRVPALLLRHGTPQLPVNGRDSLDLHHTIKIKWRYAARGDRSGRIPAFYSFVPPQLPLLPLFDGAGDRADSGNAAPPQPPNLTLVAAPGVSIELLQPWDHTPGPRRPALQIYRVQNPRMVPTLGAPFTAARFTQGFMVDLTYDSNGRVQGSRPSDSDDLRDYFDSRLASVEAIRNYHSLSQLSMVRRRPISAPNPFSDMRNQPTHVLTRPYEYLEVHRLPAGVVFRHPFSGSDLVVTVPQVAGRTGTDHVARFAYEINTQAGPSDAMVRIAMSPFVTVRLHVTDVEAASRSAVFYDVQQSPTLDDIPDQGASLANLPGSFEPVNVISSPNNNAIYREITYALADIGVGAIPVIGDIADIGEFFLALATGTDRWGRHVSTAEKWIMGVGALLPVVGSGALRAPQLAARFAGRLGSAERASGAVEALSRQLSDAQRSDIEEFAQRLRAGGRLGRREIAVADRLIRETPQCLVSR